MHLRFLTFRQVFSKQGKLELIRILDISVKFLFFNFFFFMQISDVPA